MIASMVTRGRPVQGKGSANDDMTEFMLRPSLLPLLQPIYRRKIAPGAFDIHAKAEHVAVGKSDAHEIGGNGLAAPDILVGEYRAVELLRARFQHFAADRCQRVSLVEYIIDQQHHSAGHGRPRAYFPVDRPAMRGVAVARDIEVIEFEREPEQRQQLSCEYHAAAHD